MSISRLTRIQHDLLDAFFRRETRFFLTGGAALAGFHLGHRVTQDLDLFTTDDVIDDGAASLGAATRELGATLESIETAPEFRRYLVRRGPEAVVVDLVRDRVIQIQPDKLIVGIIRVDPPGEIFANKLCALLARAEIRDLVDVRALEQAGCQLEAGLVSAASKDAGLTPSQLAWVVSQITIPDAAGLPGDVEPSTLRAYLADLVDRLVRLGHPGRG